MRLVFRYNPPTQEQLRSFLFSDSERLSTFLVKQEESKVEKTEEENQEEKLRVFVYFF